MSQRLAFAGLLALCLTIPSNWTQDVPARYGVRHPGLEHSWLYPEIDTAPRPVPEDAGSPAAPRPAPEDAVRPAAGFPPEAPAAERTVGRPEGGPER